MDIVAYAINIPFNRLLRVAYRMGAEASESLGPLDGAIAFRVYRVSRLLRMGLLKGLEAHGLGITPEQYFMLYRLLLKDGVPQVDLADNALGHYPNITRMIDGLEKKGLVERTADPSDRRKYLIKLTESGKARMDRVVPFILKERERLFNGFSDDELKTINRFFSVLETRA